MNRGETEWTGRDIGVDSMKFWESVHMVVKKIPSQNCKNDRDEKLQELFRGDSGAGIRVVLMSCGGVSVLSVSSCSTA